VAPSGLFCADVPLRNYSLTPYGRWRSVALRRARHTRVCNGAGGAATPRWAGARAVRGSHVVRPVVGVWPQRGRDDADTAAGHSALLTRPRPHQRPWTHRRTAGTVRTYIHTVCSGQLSLLPSAGWEMRLRGTPCLKKKLCQCYFLNNSLKHWPILIISGTQHNEENWRKWL